MTKKARKPARKQSQTRLKDLKPRKDAKGGVDGADFLVWQRNAKPIKVNP